jgi:hypothetical protein
LDAIDEFDQLDLQDSSHRNDASESPRHSSTADKPDVEVVWRGGGLYGVFNVVERIYSSLHLPTLLSLESISILSTILLSLRRPLLTYISKYTHIRMVATLPFQDLKITAPGFGYVPLLIYVVLG